MRIIDSHVHLENHAPKKALSMAESFGYEKFALMAIPCYCDPLNTLECLLAKRTAPDRIYTYGGMVYTPDMPANGRDHEKQLELMMDAGCDGWKLLESKPSIYRTLQLPLDGEVKLEAVSGEWRDNAVIRRVSKPDPSYKLSKKSAGGGNWT